MVTVADLIDAPRSYTKLLQQNQNSPGTYQTSLYSKETTKKIIPGTTTYSTYQKYGSPTTDPGQSKVYNYSEEYRTENKNRSLRDLPPSPRSYRSTSPSPRSPSPHRSPSPVSFAQPPEPRFNYSSSHTHTNNRTVSPQLGQKFSPSDPSRIKWVPIYAYPSIWTNIMLFRGIVMISVCMSQRRGDLGRPCHAPCNPSFPREVSKVFWRLVTPKYSNNNIIIL